MKNQGSGKAAIFKSSDIIKIRRSFNQRHRCIFEIALFTGERMGAVVQLKVSDVYADPINSIPHDKITFPARTRKARPDGSRQTRQIAIHPELAEHLKNYKPPREGYLFFTPNQKQEGHNHITRRAIDKYWREQFLKLGMDKKGYSTHSPRRWLITQLASNGIAIKKIQQITGHKNLNVLLGYIEASEEELKSAIATVRI